MRGARKIRTFAFTGRIPVGRGDKISHGLAQDMQRQTAEAFAEVRASCMQGLTFALFLAETSALVELDSFDRRLLALLQEDSRQTGKELAEKVGLSAAACLRRVQRLRESGVIEREIAIVSPRYLGQRVLIFVLVSIARDRPDRDRLFMAEMQAQPEVTQCYHVTGDSDFMLAVRTADMEAYARFTERHMYEPYVKRFESIAVLGEGKRLPPVPRA